MAHGEKDVIDPGMVLTAASVAVFFVSPGKHVFALGDGDAHPTPAEVAAPLLYGLAVDVELEVVAVLAVGLSEELNL